MKLSPLLTFNPELQRNIWLELSPGRVLGMLLVIVLLAGGVYAIWQDRYLFGVLNSVLWLLLVLWGPLLAADSVFDERLNRTWDVQRLSAQRATGLVLGKLVGGTIYAWFGAVLCIGAIIVITPDHADKLYDRVLEGVMAQSMAMFTAIIIMRFGGTARAISRLAAWAAGFTFAGYFSTRLSMGGVDDTFWYGTAIPTAKFLYGFEILTILWIVFGMIRLMRRELGYRDGPLGWFLFVVYATVFTAGFPLPEQIDSDAVKTWQSHAFFVAYAMTYVALLGLPVSIAASRKLAIVVLKHDLKNIWAEMPPWMAAFALTLVGAVLFATTSLAHALGAFALLGFFCRDILVVYGFRTRFTRRSEAALIAYFLLIYILASSVITFGYKTVTGDAQGLLLQTVSPVIGGALPIGVIFPWIEAALVYLLLRKDFAKLYRPVSP